MAYEALDVANYVIEYCNSNEKEITNLQLQKILYYIQAAFLVEKNGDVAFDDDIMAWKYGPVVPEVYREFKNYFDGPIEEISPNVFFFEEEEYNPIEIIEIEDQFIIDEVVSALIDFHGFTLIDRTHNEDPWREAYYNNEEEISIQSMYEYFVGRNNVNRIYGK